MNIFGNKDALIGSMDLFVGAALVLGAFIFRKSIANDMLDMSFSVIGSAGLGIISYLVIDNIFHAIKFSVLGALIVFLAGGFLLGDLIGDGQAS